MLTAEQILILQIIIGGILNDELKGKALTFLQQIKEAKEFSDISQFFTKFKAMIQFLPDDADKKCLQSFMRRIIEFHQEPNSSVNFSNERDYFSGEDTHWYTDDEMNILLENYFSNSDHVELLTAMLGTTWNKGNNLGENLQQFLEGRAQGSVKNKVFIPVNLNQNHWALLYILFDEKDKSQAPQVFYFDPFGNDPPAALAEVIRSQNLGDIVNVGKRLQKDDYNCGVWVIEAAKAILENGAIPDVDFNIEAARKSHQAFLPNNNFLQFSPTIFPHNGIARIYDQFPRRYCYEQQNGKLPEGGLPEMIMDLFRIAQGGYNVVWINPIQKTGEQYKNFQGQRVNGSLYATADMELFDDAIFPGIESHQDRVKLVQCYTRTARALGMMPIFDLVLNHVAIGSELEAQFKTQNLLAKTWGDILEFLGEALNLKLPQNNIDAWKMVVGALGKKLNAEGFPPIDPQEHDIWTKLLYLIEDKLLKEGFLAYKENNENSWGEIIAGLNSVLEYSQQPRNHQAGFNAGVAGGKGSWSDICALDYSSPKNRDFLIRTLWLPFIEKYIKDYGFAGVRVDAITHIRPELQKRVFEIIRGFTANPVILGELMVGNPQSCINQLKGIGFTHILTPMSLYRNFTYGYQPGLIYDDVVNKCNFLTQAYELQQIIPPKFSGGTMGMTGNHDAAPLFPRVFFTAQNESYHDHTLGNALKGKPARTNRGRSKHQSTQPLLPYPTESDAKYEPQTRERLLRIAMTCNGGWYVLAGDEYGVVTWPNVFRQYQEAIPLSKKWGGKVDTSEYIAFLNYILAQLPSIAHGDWVNHYKDNVDGNLLHVVLRHSELTGENFIICSSDLNLSFDKVSEKVKAFLSSKNIKCADIYFICQDKLFYFDNPDLQNYEKIEVIHTKPWQNLLALCCMIESQLIVQDISSIVPYINNLLELKEMQFSLEQRDKIPFLIKNLLHLVSALEEKELFKYCQPLTGIAIKYCSNFLTQLKTYTLENNDIAENNLHCLSDVSSLLMQCAGNKNQLQFCVESLHDVITGFLEKNTDQHVKAAAQLCSTLLKLCEKCPEIKLDDKVLEKLKITVNVLSEKNLIAPKDKEAWEEYLNPKPSKGIQFTQ